MTRERAWPVRAMYILIAAALAMSLMIMTAPAHKVSAKPDSNDVVSEWDKVPTPSGEGVVLAPDSTIIDYALADGGDVAYAIWEGSLLKDTTPTAGIWLLKSDNGAATWSDLNDALNKVNKTKAITDLLLVATDGADANFLAVALSLNDTTLHVYVSKDGGVSFRDASEVKDGVTLPANAVSDLAVSVAGTDGTREIAISGTNNAAAPTDARLFRCTVTGDIASAWEDVTDVNDYPGWDDQLEASAFTSVRVTDIMFSPNFKTDSTILAITVDVTSPYTVRLQSGSWGETTGAWNKKAGFPNAVPIKANVTLPNLNARLIGGITLPSDYDGTKADKRYAWVWLNYQVGSTEVGEIYRVKNSAVIAVTQQIETQPWLTKVSYWGTIDEGKAIAGVLGDGAGDDAACCDGVQVYRKDGIKSMDICCPAWEAACKPPTGIWSMAVSYVSVDKAYAVALGGSAYDEGAWSVSFDDGDIWNQLSLIDTNIDYLSDVAVSPDCNKMMLVSVNIHKVEINYCGCDSVWLKATSIPEAGYSEYSGHWLRTWTGQLTGVNSDVRNFGEYEFDFPERGLLRLAPEETTGDTVYLVDRMSTTGTIYYNDLETLNCWETRSAASQIGKIVDLAVKDEGTIYALDEDGDVSMSDDHGAAISWTKAVKSKVTSGWTIAVRNSDVLVGGRDGDVAYSEDDGATFTKLEETSSIAGLVTVAFDSYFDTNNTIYAALANAEDKNGIYRWVIDTSTEWKNLNAEKFDYTGLVLGRNPGNPMTSKDTGGVLYASYVGSTYDSTWSTSDDYFDCWKGNAKSYNTGVARTLTPAGDISCEKCIEWDYLTTGLTTNEQFVMAPYALKVCGCMDETTNTKLFAIDGRTYDMVKAKDGTVWTFEDCYAKKAPVLTSPANNTTIPADCYCSNLPFSLKWDGMCDACYYDVQIALDDQFTDVVAQWDYQEGGKDILGATGLSFVVQDWLTCQVTYYWRVRAHEASTCQIIHSWWSDTGTITVAPSVSQGTITLIAPVSGATDVGTKNVGFSWNLQASANKFDWKLSANADLSNPLGSQTGLTNTAYTYTGTLTHGTTYYWQVIAWKDSTQVSTSAVGTFTTGATGAFCCPIDGLCFDTEQQLKDHNAAEHPARPATPMWVWVVIAIGAVLVIVVIVLIFRTRRV